VVWVRERTVPTELSPFVGQVSANFLPVESATWSAWRIPYDCNIDFLDRSRYLFFQVGPQLSSRGYVDPIPDPLLHRKSGSWNRTQTSGSVVKNSDH
jgi:hypothetical protein